MEDDFHSSHDVQQRKGPSFYSEVEKTPHDYSRRKVEEERTRVLHTNCIYIDLPTYLPTYVSKSNILRYNRI